MKILKILSISVLLVATSVSNTVNAKIKTFKLAFIEIPVKTVCIKHPEAADATKYFANATIVSFEIYKAGGAAEIDKIIKLLSADANIESCTAGKITGDFSAITLSLKTAKNKAWFVSQFKKAGLTHIKLNNSAPVEADKL